MVTHIMIMIRFIRQGPCPLERTRILASKMWKTPSVLKAMNSMLGYHLEIEWILTRSAQVAVICSSVKTWTWT